MSLIVATLNSDGVWVFLRGVATSGVVAITVASSTGLGGVETAAEALMPPSVVSATAIGVVVDSTIGVVGEASIVALRPQTLAVLAVA